MFKTAHTSDLGLEMLILKDKITRAGDPMPRETIIRAAAEKELINRREREMKQDFFTRKAGWKVRPFEQFMRENFIKDIQAHQEAERHNKKLSQLRKSCKTERAFECARILFGL